MAFYNDIYKILTSKTKLNFLNLRAIVKKLEDNINYVLSGVGIDHQTLSGSGTNTHTQIDTFIASKGQTDGLAPLSGGLVPSQYLPSYVDDIVEVANYASLPVSGETGKIYLTLDDNKLYRWSGSLYITVTYDDASEIAYNNTTGMNSTNTQDAIDELFELHTSTNEPSGFDRENNITMGILELCHNDGITITKIDYDGTITTRSDGLFASGRLGFETSANPREVAIYPSDGETEFNVYIKGKKYTKTTLLRTGQISSTSGVKFIYFDANGDIQFDTTFDYKYFFREPITSVLYYDSTNSNFVTFGDERHGITMSGNTHAYLHFAENTKYISGMEITGLSSGSTTHTQVNSGEAFDEDIFHTINAQTLLPHLYYNSNVWSKISSTNSIAHLNGGVAQYNPSGTLASVIGNDCMIVFFFMTNDVQTPYCKILGQEVYANVNEARANVETALNTLILTDLPSPEFCPIGAVIVNASGELQLLSDGSTHLDLRKVNSTGSGTQSISTTSHPDLINRDALDSHPISAITGLVDSLNEKLSKDGNLSELTNKTTSRTNLDVYSKSESDTNLSNALTTKVSTNSIQALNSTNAIEIVSDKLRLYKADGTYEEEDLTRYLDDTKVTSGVYVTDEPEIGDKSLKFTRDDGSSFYVDASVFFDDTNLVTSVQGQTGNVSLSAINIPYDNTQSGLSATTEQDAIDELELNKASIDLLSSNITIFPTSVSGDFGYNRAVTSVDDDDYDDISVDIPSGVITANDQLIGSFIADAGLWKGAIPYISVTTIGNIRKTSGNTNNYSAFYFRIYKRDSGGTETLIATSTSTIAINGDGSDTYKQYNASTVMDNTWLDTDRVVIKWYSTGVIGTASEYDFQLGGSSPTRSEFPVPASVLPITKTINGYKIASFGNGEIVTKGSTTWISSGSNFDAVTEKWIMKQFNATLLALVGGNFSFNDATTTNIGSIASWTNRFGFVDAMEDIFTFDGNVKAPKYYENNVLLSNKYASISSVSDLQEVVNNIDYSEIQYNYKNPDRLLVYYGYPIAYKGLWDTTQIIADISANYDIWVVGDTYQYPTHEEYASTNTIINGVRANGVKVYGYIPIGVTTQNRSVATLTTEIGHWNTIGVDGIFLDEFGFDYGVDRDRQNSIINVVRSYNLPYIANAWSYLSILDDSSDWSGITVPAWEVTSFNTGNPTGEPLSHRDENDIFLIENFMIDNSGSITAWNSFERYRLIHEIRSSNGNTQVKLYGLSVLPETGSGASIDIDYTKMGNLDTRDKITQIVHGAGYIYDVDAIGLGGYSFGSGGYPQEFEKYYLPRECKAVTTRTNDFDNGKVTGVFGSYSLTIDMTAGAETLTDTSSTENTLVKKTAYNKNFGTTKGTVAEGNHNHDTTYLGISSNAVSASKLQTARTITISGDASGSASFDGDSDIDIEVSVSGGTSQWTENTANGIEYSSNVGIGANANALYKLEVTGDQNITGKLYIGGVDVLGDIETALDVILGV